MSTYTVELSPQEEADLKAQAAAEGLTVEQRLRQIVAMHVAAPSEAHLQRTDPVEWGRRFQEWADSHDRTKPPLSDDAVSRESIYPDPV